MTYSSAIDPISFHVSSQSFLFIHSHSVRSTVDYSVGCNGLNYETRGNQRRTKKTRLHDMNLLIPLILLLLSKPLIEEVELV